MGWKVENMEARIERLLDEIEDLSLDINEMENELHHKQEQYEIAKSLLKELEQEEKE